MINFQANVDAGPMLRPISVPFFVDAGPMPRPMSRPILVPFRPRMRSTFDSLLEVVGVHLGNCRLVQDSFRRLVGSHNPKK